MPAGRPRRKTKKAKNKSANDSSGRRDTCLFEVEVAERGRGSSCCEGGFGFGCGWRDGRGTISTSGFAFGRRGDGQNVAWTVVIS